MPGAGLIKQRPSMRQHYTQSIDKLRYKCWPPLRKNNHETYLQGHIYIQTGSPIEVPLVLKKTVLHTDLRYKDSFTERVLIE